MRNERGEGGIKVVITLVVILYGIFCAVRIISATSDDKAVEQKMEEVLKFAGTKAWGIEDMEYQISQRVKEYQIPVNPEEDVEVYEEDSQYHSELSYTRTVPLIFWTYTKPVKIHVQFTKY